MVNKFDMSALRIPVLIFLVIVMGVAFITTSSNTLAPITTASIATNESFNIASSRQVGNNINNTADVNYTVQFAQNATGNAPIASFVLLNASGGTIGAGNYSTDLTTGRFSMRNTTYTVSLTSNQTFVSYTYLGSSYDDTGTGYGFILGLGIFGLALGIVVTVIAANWPRFKELIDIG